MEKDDISNEKKKISERIKELPTRKKAQYLAIILVIAVVLAIYITTLIPDGAAASSNSLERRCSEVLSMVDGAGRVEVVINEEPLSAVVVAEGAGDIGIKMQLLKATKALLGVDAQKIEVLEMYKEE